MDRPAPRDELARAELLAHVVVRAALEPEHDVALLTLGGEHHDRDRLGGVFTLEGAADLEPVEPGQHEVEDDEARLAPPGLGEPLLAVAGDHHRIALPLQGVLEQFDDVRVVFDDEYGFLGHGSQCVGVRER